MATDAETHVRHLIQKCFAAAAICIIKCKPANVSALDFCKSIQNKARESQSSETYCSGLSHTQQAENNDNFDLTAELLDVCSGFTIDKTPGTIPETNEIKKSTRVNLKLIHALKEVKSVLSGNRLTEADNVFPSQGSIFNNSKESGYSSEKDSSQRFFNKANEGYNVEKRINGLNESLNVLIAYLHQVSDDESKTYMFIYISDIVGEVVDILFEQNVHIPSLNNAVSMVEETIDDILTTADDHMTEQWSYRMKFFFAMCKSLMLVQQALTKLINHLEILLETTRRPGEILETGNPDFINRLFFVFNLIEELLYEYNIKKMKVKSVNVEEKQTETVNEPSQSSAKRKETNLILGQNWNLSHNKYKNDSNFVEYENRLMKTLNLVAVECVESYPLISFWAMECINIKNMNKNP